MTRIAAILALGVTLTGLVLSMVYVLAMRPADDRFAECRRSRVAGGEAAIGGPFSLIDGSGARVTEADVIDGATLVYFGYTFCPDFCPNDLARNAAARDLAAANGADLGLAFITIDPERDTVEVVGEYAAAIHPEMVGLTGSAEEIAEAAEAYRVYYRRAGDDPDYYMMDHSTFTFLMAPEVGFLDFFTSDTSAGAMAEAAACYVAKL